MASSRSSVRGLTGLRRQRAAAEAGGAADATALQARLMLGNAQGATLLIDGLSDDGGRPAVPASLLDADGVPLFHCAPGSPITAAIGRDAILTTPGRTGARLAVLGRLENAGVQEVDDAVVDVVRLAPRSIMLERDGAKTAVPLQRYLQVQCEALRCSAEQIMQHGNQAHEHQLRRTVCRHRGIAPQQVAAASLTWLDSEGAELRWVDGEGSHLLWLPFPAPVTTTDELAEQLRRRLQPAE